MTAPPWPEHPLTAVPVGDVWVVKGLPPSPYPFQQNGPFDHAKFGPSGTTWVFTSNDIVDGITHVPHTTDFLALALKDLYAKLCQSRPSQQLFSWVVPADNGTSPDARSYGMRWLHVTVNAKLGSTETMSHTLNFRTAPSPDADQDQAAVQTFANQVRDIWATWWGTAYGNSNQSMASLVGSEVAYQDVTAAYLEQNAAATITTHTSRKTGHPVKDFTYPRPNYLVPTQYAPFATPVTGGNAQQQLPYEVACCVSLQTGVRGPRNRGRLYLGGLTAGWMDTNGLFKPAVADVVSSAVADLVHRLNTGTGARLHVVSRAYATSSGINGVTCGLVPDSQRRRRRSELESYGVAVAT